MTSLRKFSIWLLLSATGCASPNPADKRPLAARAHPAAYSQDHFTLDKERPERSANDFQFYYKHCTLEERQPLPKGGIWACTEP